MENLSVQRRGTDGSVIEGPKITIKEDNGLWDVFVPRFVSPVFTSNRREEATIFARGYGRGVLDALDPDSYENTH